MRFRFPIEAVCLLAWLTPAVCLGQTASLNGLIVDSSGAGVPGANIRVVQTRTNITRSLQTGAGGSYEAVNLAPGEYSVLVENPGFDKLERFGIVLSVDTATRLDLQLQPQSNRETVTVHADAPALQSASAEMSTDIAEKQYTDLPLVQAGRIRSPTSFVYLAPGLQGNIRLDGAEYTGATNVIAANGSNIWNTELLIEGLPGGQTRITGNYTESAPAVDAIAEFKITTASLGADYGHTGAAVGSFAVRSGTNDWHGSVYEYLRNNILDANNWLANSNSAVHPPTRQNEFGATIGGPLTVPRLYRGKDRTFFFFAYGGSRKTGADSYTLAAIPTPNMIGGDFTGAASIYDPHSTTANPSGTGYVRTVFPGKIVPASLIDPVSQRIAAYYPAPNVTGANNYGSFTGEVLLNPNTYTAKLDHALNESHRFSAVYVHTYIPRLRLDSAPPAPLATGIHQFVGSHTARLTYNWIASPRVLNEFRAGFNRFTNPQDAVSAPADYPKLLGLTGLSGNQFPSMSLTGYTTIGNTTASRAAENDYYSRDVLHWSLARHSLRFGGEFRRVQYNDLSPYQQTASLAFNSLETANPQATSNTGDGFASLLLGAAHSATLTNPFGVYTRKSYAGAFVQDDWRASKRLTLNLGFRWERSGAPVEAHGDGSILNLAAPNAAAGNLPGAAAFGGNLFPQGPSAWGPRFGFAYQLSGRLVVRGGYGLYYTDILPNTSLVSTGYQVANSFTSADNGVTPAFYLSAGVPAATIQSATLSAALFNGQNASYYGSDAGRMPRIQDWNFTVQAQVSTNLVVEVAGVGNHGTGLVAPQMANVNQMNSAYLSLGTLLTQAASSAAAVSTGIKLPYSGFSGTVAQALRPYPQLLTLTSVAAKTGASKYDGLQVVVRKRTSAGFAFDGNYTFSKAMGYNNTSLGGNSGVDNTLQNAYAPQAEWSLLPQDVTRAAVFHYTYEVPLGKGAKWLRSGGAAGAIVSGWSVSAVQRYQSGYPLSLLTKNTLAIFNRVLRPNVAAGVPLASGIANGSFDPSRDSVFNKSAFSAPVNSFGNAAPAYSSLRNFPVRAEDLAMVKHNRLTEKLELRIYAQAFNILNRHRFTGIDTTYSDNAFGMPSATNQARQIQFGARLAF